MKAEKLNQTRKAAQEKKRTPLTWVGIISGFMGAILAFDILVGLLATIIFFALIICTIKCKFIKKLVDQEPRSVAESEVQLKT